MKKVMRTMILMTVLVLGLAACGDKEAASQASGGRENVTAAKTEIAYSKSQGPYTELFEAAIVPLLENQGYTLKGVDFSELLTADIALNDGEVDVNVEQHTAYAENFNANYNGNLVPISPIPTVPAGIYSANHGSLEEIADGAKIAVPNDASNTARAYACFKRSAGLRWIQIQSLRQSPRTTLWRTLKIWSLWR